MQDSNSTIWTSVARLKTLAELVAALIVATPLVLASLRLLQQGLRAVIPAWLILLPTAVAIACGYLLLKKKQTDRPGSAGATRGDLIQRIDFDYSDSPANHGWRVEADKDGTQPLFRRVLDGHVGSALEIKSTIKSRLEIAVSPAVALGTSVEFLVKLEPQYRIFVCVTVRSKGSSKSRDLWLGYQIGTEPPKRIDDGTWYEYRLSITPTRIGGDWLQINIDLADAVRQTAATEGWAFGQLKMIRFRGNLSVANVSIFG